jgi:hypothetical protein
MIGQISENGGRIKTLLSGLSAVLYIGFFVQSFNSIFYGILKYG